ncbi:MAG: patatin-like phospholipase family protein [Clostridia bacterium]|nr:patatin-like phospholipase family protein [Clostridia bacterium]
MKFGLALAGGGLKGVAYIGAIKALEELGIKIDCISGTSSGSFAAVLYAVGYSCNEIKDIILKSYKDLTKIERRPIISTIGSYLTSKKLKISGLIPGERLEDLVQKVVEKKSCSNISDINIPIAVSSVDTISMKECIFMSKNFNLKNSNMDYIYDIPLGKAVRSSMAFPGIFTTSRYKQYNFIDGGTKDNLPVRALKDMGADVTLGLSFKMDEYDIESENVFGVLLRTVDIFSQKQLKSAQSEASIAIEIDAKGTSLLSSDNIEKCISLGYDAIMENKNKILKCCKIEK